MLHEFVKGVRDDQPDGRIARREARRKFPQRALQDCAAPRRQRRIIGVMLDNEQVALRCSGSHTGHAKQCDDRDMDKKAHECIIAKTPEKRERANAPRDRRDNKDGKDCKDTRNAQERTDARCRKNRNTKGQTCGAM